MVFCNRIIKEDKKAYDIVTILILIDGFLQYVLVPKEHIKICSHNPYFNRWFSAIYLKGVNTVDKDKSQSLF